MLFSGAYCPWDVNSGHWDRVSTGQVCELTNEEIDQNIAISYIAVMKAIQYSRDAKKSLDRMQPKRRLAIIAKLEAYARGESVDIKKMQGSEYYRIRVGQDRVIIDDQGIVVMVIDAGPRGGIYKE
ncbi:type II toxin-antitoxin system RelE family toxin [Rhizobium sp. PAMB 3174]